jgi:hypothetical protein
MQQIAFSRASSACGITTVGTIECWGTGFMEEPPFGQFVDLALSFDGGCAIRGGAQAGTLECWGSPDTPTLLYAPTVGAWTSIAGDDGAMCALDEDGAVECWGAGPGLVAPDSHFREISGSESMPGFCGVTTEGVVECWAVPCGINCVPPQ